MKFIHKTKTNNHIWEQKHFTSGVGSGDTTRYSVATNADTDGLTSPNNMATIKSNTELKKQKTLEQFDQVIFKIKKEKLTYTIYPTYLFINGHNKNKKNDRIWSVIRPNRG